MHGKSDAGNEMSQIMLPKDFCIDDPLYAMLNEQEVLPAQADYCFIIEKRKFIKVLFSDIMSIEASRVYVIINMLSGGKYHLLITLNELEKRLPVRAFCRVHRSCIIPFEGITEIRLHQIMVHGRLYPLSEAYRKKLIALLSPFVFHPRFPRKTS
ncbi:MAG: LytTR family DNA-binding domain-containing protein [Bacteroidota bacterium]